jgi:hypothetical protein
MDNKPPIVGKQLKKKEESELKNCTRNYDNKNVELITSCIVGCLIAGGSIFLLYETLVNLFHLFVRCPGA